MHRKRLVILAGGLSPEREVSLRSGRRVTEALTAVGHDACMRDADASLLVDLQRDRPDCVVPLLHGQAGEDGSLQELLELSGVPYVGSPPGGARSASAKPVAKYLVSRAGITTPDSVALESSPFREIGASVVLAALVSRLGLPLIVKPAVGGSALGCSVVTTPEDLPAAMVTCFAFGPLALVEKYVAGVEVAVPVLDTQAGPRALPAVEIRPTFGRYDYAARYTAGATEFVVPAELPPEVAADCAQVALDAHRCLGLRDLSRSDLIVDQAGRVTFLEANVAPGMTETSLVPLSIRAAGLSVAAVFEELCGRAGSRSGPATSR